MRFVAPLLAALLATMVVTPAFAEKSTAHLVYVRGDLADCPDEQQVRDAVAARLGYDPFEAKSSTTVTAVLTKGRAGLRAHVELRDLTSGAVGRRELTSARNDCAELASAMELAIAIAVDPQSLTRPAGTPPPSEAPAPSSPAPPAAPPPSAPTPSPPPAPPERRASESPSLLFGALGSVGYGITPAVSVAPVLFVGVRLGRWSLRLDGRFYVPGAEDAPPTGSVRASLFAGALAPCVHVGVGVACALVVVGQLRGEGRGVDVPLERSALYSGAGLRAGLEWPLGRWGFLPAYAEAIAPFTRETLRLRDRDVWESPAVTLSLLLGLGVHFE